MGTFPETVSPCNGARTFVRSEDRKCAMLFCDRKGNLDSGDRRGRACREAPLATNVVSRRDGRIVLSFNGDPKLGEWKVQRSPRPRSMTLHVGKMVGGSGRRSSPTTSTTTVVGPVWAGMGLVASLPTNESFI